MKTEVNINSSSMKFGIMHNWTMIKQYMSLLYSSTHLLTCYLAQINSKFVKGAIKLVIMMLGI